MIRFTRSTQRARTGASSPCWRRTLGALTCLLPVLAPATLAQDPPAAADATTEFFDLEIPGLPPPMRDRRHRVAASADYLFGFGHVALPTGWSLLTTEPGAQGIEGFEKSDRESDYFGATISYAWDNRVFVEASYIKGRTSGTESLEWLVPESGAESSYRLDDEWYQIHLRFLLSRPEARLSSFVRLAVSYVEADTSTFNLGVLGFGDGDLYLRSTSSRDVLGGVGFGLAYELFATHRVSVRAQLEGEGFYGKRDQSLRERAFDLQGFGVKLPEADLYGGQARLTVRVDLLPIRRLDALRTYIDFGMQSRYMEIRYPSDTIPEISESISRFESQTEDELLWGPYVKVGLNYSF
jgi:hypothetical protein